jgi:ribosomal protein S18 acetylase RimI-like enzyme
MITMSDIEIKRIGVADVTALSEIAIHAYCNHYKYLWYDEGKWYIEKCFSKENLLHELKDADAWFFIIYHSKEAIGFLKLNINTPFPGEENINALELERIYLTRSASGKGIGKKIIDYISNIATENDKKLIWLKAMDSSTDAIEFYKKMKFEICGTAHLNFEMMKPEYRGMYIMKKLL